MTMRPAMPGGYPSGGDGHFALHARQTDRPRRRRRPRAGRRVGGHARPAADPARAEHDGRGRRRGHRRLHRRAGHRAHPARARGGAAGLVAAFAVIAGGERQARRLWLGTAVLATAIGPALGGALTQAFDWRAIFVAQAPVAVLAALACALGPPVAAPARAPERPDERFGWRPALALALVSAALTAVLFLLVLVLVAGFGVTPLRGAVTVTVLPVAALVATRIGGNPWVRASAGCALVGGGVLALGWLPDARLAWTLVPQAVAGLGMGLALTALGGELLPERTPDDAARLLTLRHAGIAVILAVLAPIVAHQLDTTTEHAREQGVALVLDAPLPPREKIGLAPALLKG